MQEKKETPAPVPRKPHALTMVKTAGREDAESGPDHSLLPYFNQVISPHGKCGPMRDLTIATHRCRLMFSTTVGVPWMLTNYSSEALPSSLGTGFHLSGPSMKPVETSHQ
jgi:hypothetical protein